MAARPVRRQSAFQLNSQTVINVGIPLLRPHQRDAIAASQQQFQNQPNQPALVVLPTGCGKTGIAVFMAYVSNSRNVLILTPSKVISEQIQSAFGLLADEESFFEKIRLFAGAYRRDYAPQSTDHETTKHLRNQQDRGFLDLTIANAQKFGPRTPFVGDDNRITIPADSFDLVIVDEAHHYPSDTWRRIVDHFPCKKLFLTATPNTRNGQLPWAPVYSLSLEKAIRDKLIRRTRFQPVGVTDGENEYQSVCRTIHAELLARSQNHPHHYHQAMIIAESVEAIADIVAAYNLLYPRQSRGFHSKLPPKNKKNKEKFQDKLFRTMVVCSSLLEGFDHSNVSVVGVIRNIAPESRTLFTQFVGRAVRKMEDEGDIDALIVSYITRNQEPNYLAFINPVIADGEGEEEIPPE